MPAQPSQYAATLEVDSEDITNASRKEGHGDVPGDVAAVSRAVPLHPPASFAAVDARVDDDGPEFCCPGGIYENNPTEQPHWWFFPHFLRMDFDSQPAHVWPRLRHLQRK